MKLFLLEMTQVNISFYSYASSTQEQLTTTNGEQLIRLSNDKWLMAILFTSFDWPSGFPTHSCITNLQQSGGKTNDALFQAKLSSSLKKNWTTEPCDNLIIYHFSSAVIVVALDQKCLNFSNLFHFFSCRYVWSFLFSPKVSRVHYSCHYLDD